MSCPVYGDFIISIICLISFSFVEVWACPVFVGTVVVSPDESPFQGGGTMAPSTICIVVVLDGPAWSCDVLPSFPGKAG